MNHVKNSASLWAGEKRLYEGVFYATTGQRARVLDVPPGVDELGYTTADKEIYLAYEHPIMNPLDEKKAAMFRYGVFTHEMLHQIFTSFSHLEQTLDACPDAMEREIIALFANLVEDPAIEYAAPTEIGGEMLEALRYMIRHVYLQSPFLEESQSAFTQFVNALIQFGDMGLLKGDLSFPEAKRYFLMLAPEFNQGVINPDPKARIELAKKWAVLTRPLWKKEAEENEKFMDTLRKILEQKGKMPKGTGHGKTTDGEPGGTPQSERRNEFAKALGDGKGETAKSDGSSPANDPASCSKGEANDAESGMPAPNGQRCESPDDVLERFKDTGISVSASPNKAYIDEHWDEISETAREMEESDADTMDFTVHIPVTKTSGSGAHKITCINERITATKQDEAAYAAIRQSVGHHIRLLTTRLKTTLRMDYDEDIRSTSGRYNIRRAVSKSTVKVFDKRKERKNIADMAVILLVDMSRSMIGNKITVAKETAVMLAETFDALDIPCYVMGFTADTRADVQHSHFVTWKNTPAERLSLTKIRAIANNDDGYSIRYAAALLRKKQAQHKLLFVISDGAPVCRRYRFQTDGIADTSLAIKEARQFATVYGIGIGKVQSEELAGMYKGAYTNIRKVADLPVALGKQLGRIVARF